jgi:hypothetical protein
VCALPSVLALYFNQPGAVASYYVMAVFAGLGTAIGEYSTVAIGRRL